MTDPDVIPAHRCWIPGGYVIGDIARCRECGTWKKAVGHPRCRRWRTVRWWHLRDRATIRRHTRQTRKGDA